LRVLLRVRSNMKRMATASLQTSGSMLTNSRWPPRSQIEKVISVLRMEIVFSMKLTPLHLLAYQTVPGTNRLTQCLDVILIPTSFHVLDHQARLADLCITHHANLDDHTILVPCCLRSLVWRTLVLLLVCIRVPISLSGTRQARWRPRHGLHWLLLVWHVGRGIASVGICIGWWRECLMRWGMFGWLWCLMSWMLYLAVTVAVAVGASGHWTHMVLCATHILIRYVSMLWCVGVLERR